jgi:hypothetical protein
VKNASCKRLVSREADMKIYERARLGVFSSQPLLIDVDKYYSFGRKSLTKVVTGFDKHQFGFKECSIPSVKL